MMTPYGTTPIYADTGAGARLKVTFVDEDTVELGRGPSHLAGPHDDVLDEDDLLLRAYGETGLRRPWNISE